MDQIPKLENERFVKITEFDNYYISDFGRVWNSIRKIILSGGIGKDNYMRVNLTKEGKPKKVLIHRLVAQHFIENPDNKPEVNHLGEKTDNRSSMLEWATRKENCQHSADHKIKFRQVSVQQIDPITEEVIKTYLSLIDTKDDGFLPTNVYDSIKYGQKAGGYYWKYTEEKKEVTIPNEKWYDLKNSIYDEVKCFPKYQVSDQGRVKGWFGRILTINYCNGVGNIKLTNDEVTKMFKIHRLVLMGCNIANPDNKPEVDHIDSNYTNNVLSNLRWATRKDQVENINTIEKRPVIREKFRKKIEVTYEDKITLYQGMSDLSKKLGIASVTINKYAELDIEYKGYKFKIII